MIKLIYLTTFFSFFIVKCFSQQTKESYQANQHLIDRNYGGVGLTFMSPNLGSGVVIPKRWYGVNFLSDFFEAEFMMGETNKVQPFVKKDEYQPPLKDYGNDYGYLLSIGANAPINFLKFGAYKNPTILLRGHPTLGANLGFGRFKHVDQSKGKSSIYFLGVNVGYRIRIPIGSIEVNLKSRLGWSGVDDFAGTGYDFYKGTGVTPSVTLRVDAMKGLFNTRMVSANVAQASVSNVKSETKRTSSRYVGGNRIDSYSTTTTGDVSVTSGNIGVQDIGPHFGIGPKVSFMNLIRSRNIKPSFLFGMVGEGRINILDYGFTIEGGNVGHGSALRFTGVDEPRKKLDKKESVPLGSVSVVNAYGNFGFDVSPAFLVPFGIVIDKVQSTSFFSATAGFNLGVHGAFNQKFDDPSVAQSYVDLAQSNENGVKEKFLNPAEVGTGAIAGLYFSMQVGAASFKVSNLRYSGAPFASTTMLSLAWRFPLKVN